MLALHSPVSKPGALPAYEDDRDIEASLADRRQTVSQRSKEDDIEEEDEDKVPQGYDSTRDGKYGPEKQAERWDGKWGPVGKAMGWLIRNGCEARGIQPVRVEDRAILSKWSYLPQATIWAAANTNILTISSGILGPELFNLPLDASIGVIVGFNMLACLPVAYFATFGPKLGLRQMVMSRYSFGFWPVLLPALFNACTAIGFLSLNAILGGQTLSLSSAGGFGWSLGIVLVGIIGILPSFLGLRALHIFSISLLPFSAIIFLAVLGLAAPHLSSAISSPENVLSPVTTAGGVLGFGGTLLGFAATWAAFASDFTTYLPPHTKSLPLFLCTYFGLLTPLVLLQILGAAIQLAAGAIPAWEEGEAANGVGGLIGGVVGNSGGGKFLLVLIALNVTGNVAPTIYSAGLSLQVVVPWLLRVPRYFLAVIITCIYIPVALALSTQATWTASLSNFLYIIGYWIALYLPAVIWENILFRHPMTTKGPSPTYNLRVWDDAKRLPVGYAAVFSWAVGIPALTAGISQVWWVGWAAQRINGGLGDIAFLLGFGAASVAYISARWLERRYIGR